MNTSCMYMLPWFGSKKCYQTPTFAPKKHRYHKYIDLGLIVCNYRFPAIEGRNRTIDTQSWKLVSRPAVVVIFQINHPTDNSSDYSALHSINQQGGGFSPFDTYSEKLLFTPIFEMNKKMKQPPDFILISRYKQDKHQLLRFHAFVSTCLRLSLANLPSCSHDRLPCWHPALIRGCTRTWLSQIGWDWDFQGANGPKNGWRTAEEHWKQRLYNFQTPSEPSQNVHVHRHKRHMFHVSSILKNQNWSVSIRNATWHRGPAPGGAAAEPEAGLGWGLSPLH